MSKMSGKQIMQQTLSGTATDQVPCGPIYLSLYCRPLWRRELAGIYREMAGGRSELTLSFENVLEAELEAWDRAWRTFAQPPDWMPLRWGGGRSRSSTEGSTVALSEGSCVWSAADGSEQTDYLADEKIAGDKWDLDLALTSEADLEALVPLRSWESWLDDGQDLWFERALARWGEDYLLTQGASTPFWAAYNVLGFSGLMRAVKQQPQTLERLTARLLHNRRQQITALAQAGVPCLFVEECFTGADMISEADFARLVWPPLRDMLAYATDQGLLTVFYFTGEITGRLPYLAQSAAHALAFEEDKKHIRVDLAEIRRAVGPDKALFGNLDVTVLRDAPQERVQTEIAAEAETAGPPFVVSVGSPVTLDTQPHRVSWLTEAARRLSR